MNLPNPVTTARIARLVASIGPITASVSAVAQQATLRYGPQSNGGVGPGAGTPTSIPTLGGVGLVLLSTLLLFIFWRLQRTGNFRGTRFLTIALISGALASGLGGTVLVGDAVAQSAIFKNMTSQGGGTLTFEPAESACVHNATKVPLQVLAMDRVSGRTVQPTEDCGLSDQGLPETYLGCGEGSVLAPGEVCGALADAHQQPEPPETSPEPEAQIEQVIGSEGGVLEVDDVTLTIPPGALASDVEIGIALSSGLIRQPNGNLSLSSPLITLTPHGQVFNTPVSLSFPYGILEENPQVYRLDDEEDTTWEQVPGSLDNGKASVELSNFSILGAWGPRPSQIMTFDFSLSASNFVLTNRATGAELPGAGASAPVDPLTFSFSATFDIGEFNHATPSDVTMSGGLSLLYEPSHQFNPLCCPWLDLHYPDQFGADFSMPLLGGSVGGQYGMQLTLHSLPYNPRLVDFLFSQDLFAGNFVDVTTWRPRQGSITITGPTGTFTRSWQQGPRP